MRSLGDVLYNFHWIAPAEAARSSQAYIGLLEPFLRRHRIRTMINLRGPNPGWRWWQYEKRVSARAGVRHLDVALSSKNLPTRAMLLALLDAFDTAAMPVLIKCSGGQDRTSLAAALYLLHTRGWSALPMARAQFASIPYFHLPRANQRWLQLFPEFAREAAGARSLRQWILSDYDPADFKTWLETNGFAGSFRAIHD